MNSAGAKSKIKLALFWPKYSKVTFFDELVLKLAKDRFDVMFIYLSGHGVERNLLEEAGHKVFYLSNINRINAFRLSILLRLIKILKEHKVDILHCHRHKPSFYGALGGKFARTPVVLSHVHGLSRTRNLGRRLFNSFTLRKVNRVIGCARSVRDDVLRNNPHICPEKAIALENSINFARFAGESTTKSEARSRLPGVPEDAFVYGTVARFGPYKGHRFLIKAFEGTRKQVPSAQLILAGDGPMKEEIQKQVVDAALGDSVHFLGRRNDIPVLLKAMDAFVLPSVGSEGMPLAILEAMAAGVPCIASSLSGIPEVINDSDVGLLVPPEDEDALAKAMIALAETSELERQALAERARERVRGKFNHDVVGTRLVKLYENEFQQSTGISAR